MSKKQIDEAGRAKAHAGVRVSVDPEERTAMIAQLAYFRAELRGFAPGGELRDWLDAEAEVDAARAAGQNSAAAA